MSELIDPAPEPAHPIDWQRSETIEHHEPTLVDPDDQCVIVRTVERDGGTAVNVCGNNMGTKDRVVAALMLGLAAAAAIAPKALDEWLQTQGCAPMLTRIGE